MFKNQSTTSTSENGRQQVAGARTPLAGYIRVVSERYTSGRGCRREILGVGCPERFTSVATARREVAEVGDSSQKTRDGRIAVLHTLTIAFRAITDHSATSLRVYRSVADCPHDYHERYTTITSDIRSTYE